nr:minor capsid protein [uncultured Sphaerochaeta sp.]
MKKEPGLLNTGEWYPKANATLIKQGYELFLRSYLEGMADASAPGKDMADGIPKPLKFDEAIAFAKAKISMAKSDYKALSDQMRYRAWTVGRLSQVDAIDKVRNHYLKQLTGDESSLVGFIDSIKADDALVAAGFGEESPWYYETVYRTNIMTDYNAGRATAYTSNQPVALEFIGIEDSRQTSICASRTGTILPYTDPWWESNWPPLHYNCRSTIRPIYKEEAEVTGLDVKGLQKTGVPKEAVKSQPSGGFGKNPIMDNEFWAPTAAQQGRINRALIQEELNGVAGETVCADFKEPREGWVIDDAPSKGGVRYPGSLAKETEFQSNLRMARTLSDRGYFVELRKAEKLAGNRQFDAWINATERWEFKSITGNAVRTMSEAIGEAARQAQRVMIEIASSEQLRQLEKAIISRAPLIKKEGRMISVLCISRGKKMVTITWKELQDSKRVSDILTSLLD